MDQYTDEDSDVTLLRGAKIPKHGPVCIPPTTAVDNDPEARLAGQVSEPGSFVMEPKPPHQPATSSTSSTASPAGESRGATALTSDQAALIEKNKKAALERRALIKVEAQRSQEQKIFESMQRVP